MRSATGQRELSKLGGSVNRCQALWLQIPPLQQCTTKKVCPCTRMPSGQDWYAYNDTTNTPPQIATGERNSFRPTWPSGIAGNPTCRYCPEDMWAACELNELSPERGLSEKCGTRTHPHTHTRVFDRTLYRVRTASRQCTSARGRPLPLELRVAIGPVQAKELLMWFTVAQIGLFNEITDQGAHAVALGAEA